MPVFVFALEIPTFIVVCKVGATEALVEQLFAEYGKDCALVAYLSDVTVLRADKF